MAGVRWLPWLLVVVTAGCAPAGSALPALAPTPSPPVTTAELTLSQTSFNGSTRSIRIRPDGEWFFTPVDGSPLAVVISHGRLDPPAHARLARLLTAPALHAEAALPDGGCPGGYRYHLDTARATATWTDCDAPDRPALTAVLSLVSRSGTDF